MVLALYSCANPIPPDGGPRDETPPQIDTLNSTPNYQTNFGKQPIELTFDEWVELDDIYNNMIISPPLAENPEIKIKKRTVILTFTEEEELRPDATYTINFGEGIKDLTEGNPTELLFVFATGDELDSLSISGVIVDALKGEPVEDVRFLLYENLADSVVYTERPFYSGKTDTSGQFVINYIKEGVFKGFALKDDSRRDYLFSPGEAIGFPDTLIVLADSLPSPFLTIKLFEETGPARLLDEETEEFGLVKINFNEPVKDLDVSTPNGPEFITTYDKDTLLVWYVEEQNEPWNLIIDQDTLASDTIRIPAVNSGDFFNQARLRRTGPEPAKIPPNKNYQLKFNHPIAQTDTNLFVLYEDTSRNVFRPTVSTDSLERFNLTVSHRWKIETPYELEILPGGIYDIFGLPNVDTIRQNFQVDARDKYSNLVLTVENLDSLESYIIQIQDRSEKPIVEEFVSQVAKFQKNYNLLPPGQYTARIITDWNANRKWDTGSYDARLQPEPIYLKPLEQLRANWDVEAVVRLGEISEIPKE